MRKFSYLLMLAVLALSACKEQFRKAKDGTEYMVIPSKGGKLVTNGNIIAIDMLVKYKDSVLNDTYAAGMPQFAPYDTAQLPPLYKEVFKNIHVGDSIIMKLSTDSIMKQGQAAPFMQKGQFIVINYKISNAYATQQEADSARKLAMVKAEAIAKVKAEEQLKKDDKTLTDYFAKNNIKVIKAPQGTYVQIITPGTGNNIDTATVAKANYTGTVLGGKIPFDSNTDPSKGHMEPLSVNLTNDPSLGQPLIKGMLDGFTLLNKGAKAKLYIPSSLGYGAQSMGPEMPPNSILVFDVDVLDVMNKAQAKADIEAKTKKMQEMQKRYLDSVKKAQADTAKLPKK
ncbi:MAG: FKBP-type peptidyl-prolyl cis-trans isomerase [Bacteroidetes bacterium]|nr:FKBP-type peptidyl-prolyl cis-trans isomerase [Bacteroidota bacterium]